MSFRLAHLLPSRGDVLSVDLGERSGSKPAVGRLAGSRAAGNRSVIDFIIRNRIHLLPAAALIAWAAPPLYGSTPSWNSVPSVLLAGFGIYQLNRVFDVVEDEINDPDACARTSAGRTLVGIIAISAMLASILLSILLVDHVATIALSAIISAGILYSVPCLRRERTRIRLKQVPGLKNVIPSVVWPFATVVYPALSGSDVVLPQLLLAVTGLSCGIFTIEVAWDVRDSRGDRIAGIRTLANTLGSHRALLVPLVASCGQAVVIVLLVTSGGLGRLWLLPAFLLVLLPAVAYLWKDSLASNRDRSHLLVLMNMLALILLGLAGRLGDNG